MPEFRMLACFAHPDDEAFPVGGALASHASRGVKIRLVTTTLGEEGEIRQPGAATPETLGSVRRVELARAVRIDPSQIRGLGPSLDALIAMLE